MAIAGVLELQLLANVARLQRDMSQATGIVTGASKQIESAIAQTKSVLASLGIGLGIGVVLKSVTDLADGYTKFTAQLRLASAGQKDYEKSLDDVRRISKLAQQDIAATGVLYARIQTGTAELGLSQQKVANVTETVSLALKASGATASEAKSAMLQLSQAFASGTLRGEEFNAVNEAAPRLMKALADGMGVPVGALKQMATEGKITSAIMADALPKALRDLRIEAASINTIGGALTVLKNNAMELVGQMVPAFDAISKGFAAMSDETDKAAASAFGLKDVFQGLGEVLRVMALGVVVLWTALKNLTTDIATLATVQLQVLKGNLIGAYEAMEEGRKKTDANTQSMLAFSDKALAGSKVFGDTAISIGQMGDASLVAKPKIDGATVALQAQMDEAKKLQDVLDRLNKVDKTYEESLGALARAANKGGISMQQYAHFSKLAADQSVAGVAAAAKAREAINKAGDAEKKRLDELKKLRELDAKGWVEYIEALEDADEKSLLQMAKNAETLFREKERLRQIDLQGWVAYIDAQTAEYEEGLRDLGAKTKSNILVSDEAKKDLEEFLNPAKAKSFGEALADGFGKAGSALGKLVVAFEAFGRKQAEIDKARAENAKFNDPAIRAQNEIKLAEMSAQAQISAYGDMAAAAKGFFEAGSSGYKALEAAEKVFRAFELASAIQTMLTKSGLLTAFTSLFVASKATEVAATVASVPPTLAADAAKGASAAAVGVATQAQGEPYTAWVRMAAMAATMAALGFAISGSFGGGGGGMTAAQRQREQGTGTVLGDPTAKSESLTKSIQEIEKIDRIGLTYTHDMLQSLRSIDSAMSNLATLIFRTTGITTGTDIGVQGLGSTTTARPLVGGLDSLNQSIANALGIGNLVSGILGLWGKTTKEITDAGIRVMGTVGELIAGIGIQSFANVRTTTSSWFGLSKDSSDSTELGAIDPRLLQQFKLIFGGIVDSVESAAKALDIWFPAMSERLQAFIVDLGDISLKDLKGQELQDALNNIFSSFGDDLALSILPTEFMDRFAKVGEGAFQTMMRIAAENELVKNTFDALGITLNASGTAATMARLELVQLMGGAEEFAEKTQSYFENFFSDVEQHAIAGANLNAEFARLGETMPTTKDGFRDLVESLDLSTESGRKMFAALMAINEPFAEWADAIIGLDGKLHTPQETADQRTGLEDRFAVLSGTTTEQQLERQAEINGAIDEYNLMLIRAVHALEDKRAAEEAALGLRRDEMSLEADLADALGDTAAAQAIRYALETEGMNDAERASYDYTESLKQQIEVARLAAAAMETKGDLESELFGLSHSDAQILERTRALKLEELAAQEKKAGLDEGTLTNIYRQIIAQEDYNAALEAAEEAAKEATRAFETMQNQMREFQNTRIGGATLEDAQFNADAAFIAMQNLVPGLTAFEATVSLSAEQFGAFSEEQRTAILNYRKANEAVLNFSNSLIPRDATGNPLPSGGYWDFSSGYGVWVVSGGGGGGGTQDNSQDILRQKLEMLASIYELTGDKAGAAAVLEQQHAIALAALDPSLRDLQTQLWGLEAAAVAAAKSLSFANAERDLLIQIARASGNEAQAVELERDAIRQRIEEEWGVGTAAASRLISMYEELWAIQGDVATAGSEWIKQLQDWLRNLQLDTTLSPLTANQRFDFAQQQYVETLMKAQGGDADARAQFTQVADAYLRESLSMFGRASVDYEAIWRAIQDQTQGLIDVGLGATAPATMSDLQSTFQSGESARYQQTESLLAEVRSLNTRIDQLTRVTEESGDKITTAVESQTDDLVTSDESIARNYQTPTTEARLV